MRGYNLYRLDPVDPSRRTKMNQKPLGANFQVLRNFDPDKAYKVGVTTLYEDGESDLSQPLLLKAP